LAEERGGRSETTQRWRNEDADKKNKDEEGGEEDPEEERYYDGNIHIHKNGGPGTTLA